jgi:hypothetical protein
MQRMNPPSAANGASAVLQQTLTALHWPDPCRPASDDALVVDIVRKRDYSVYPPA